MLMKISHSLLLSTFGEAVVAMNDFVVGAGVGAAFETDSQLSANLADLPSCLHWVQFLLTLLPRLVQRWLRLLRMPYF